MAFREQVKVPSNDMRTRIRLLAQAKPMSSIIGTIHREPQRGSA